MGQATSKQKDYAALIADTLGIKAPVTNDFNTLNLFIAGYRKDFYRIKNEAIINKIKSDVHIVDVARELGYTPMRVGSYYTLKEYDSVRIGHRNGEEIYVRNSDNTSGTVIDFAMNIGNMSYQEAIKYLSGLAGIDNNSVAQTARNYSITTRLNKKEQVSEKKKEDLILPETVSNMRPVFYYLTHTRAIHPEIVQHLVSRKIILQDTRRNCVFVSRDDDGTPVFASLRGTNTSINPRTGKPNRFISELKGSDYTKGFYIDNKANKTIVTESVIDAMSVMDIINCKGRDYTGYNYLVLTGTAKTKFLKNVLLQHPVSELYIATDYDKAGIEALEQIKSLINTEELDIDVYDCLPDKKLGAKDEAKDWNEKLKYAFKYCMNYGDIDFFKDKRTEKEKELSIPDISSISTQKKDLEKEIEL